MGSFKTYIIIMSVLLVLFHFAGLVENTANSTLLSFMLNPEGVDESPLAGKVGAGIAVAGVVAAVIVGFISGSIELAGAFLVIEYLLSMGWDFTQVVMTLYAESGVLAIIIMSPVLLAYLITAFEFWRGRD